MPRFGRLCLALALTGCASPRTGISVPGSEATVVAPPDLAERVAHLVERYEPAIIAMLGTRREGPYWIRTTEESLGPYHVARAREFEPWFDWLPGRSCDVVLGGDVKPKDFDHTTLHELTHVHAQGSWLGLPDVVKEGVSDWVPLVVMGRVATGGRPKPPSPERLGQVLTLSMWDFASHPERAEIREAAMWVASYLFSKEAGQPERGTLWDTPPGQPYRALIYPATGSE